MPYPGDSYERMHFGECPDCAYPIQERAIEAGKIVLRCLRCGRTTAGVWSERAGKFIVTHRADGARTWN